MPGNHAHHTVLNHHIYHTHNTCFNYQIDMRPCEHENVSVQLWYSIAQCILMGLNGCIPCNRFFSVFCIVHALSAAIYQTHGQAHTCTECETNSQYTHIFEFVHSNPCFLLFSAVSLACLFENCSYEAFDNILPYAHTTHTHPCIYNHSHLQSMPFCEH